MDSSTRVCPLIHCFILAAVLGLGYNPFARANYFDDVYKQGKVLLNQKDYTGAVRYFSEAIQTDPGFAGSYFYRGYAFECQKDYQNAIQDFSTSIKLDPTSEPAFLHRGRLRYLHRDYSEAAEDFNTAIKLKPNEAYAYFNLGLCHGANPEKAIADYSHAIKIDPNFALAYNNRANSAERIGKYPEVISDKLRAIQLQPNLVLLTPGLWMALAGVFLYSLGRLKPEWIKYLRTTLHIK